MSYSPCFETPVTAVGDSVVSSDVEIPDGLDVVVVGRTVGVGEGTMVVV